MTGAALIAAAPVLAQADLKTCYACHGESGISSQALTPSLAAQPAFYVTAQLVLFRSGQRKSPLMESMAKTLQAADIRALADAIEKLPPPKAASQDMDP